MFNKLCCAFFVLLGVFVPPTAALAQGLETLGSRAAAFAAFVAVADDASAVAWNPSGLVSGPIFNLSLDLGRSTDQPEDPPIAGASGRRLGTTLVAIGTTPVGLAYYRIASTSLVVSSPAVMETPDRQNRQVVVRTVVTSHLGATVQQSVGDYLTLGATLKLVRGSVGEAAGIAATWDQGLDTADAMETRGSTRGDVDLGAMLAVGRMRAGLVLRNATAPTFGDEDRGARARLDRHARVGVAWANRWPAISQTVVAFDADLTRVPHAAGERRDVAAGIERWMRGQQIGVRGGFRASTVGDARPVASVGGSYAIRAGTYVDAYVARGTEHDRAWGLTARLTF